MCPFSCDVLARLSEKHPSLLSVILFRHYWIYLFLIREGRGLFLCLRSNEMHLGLILDAILRDFMGENNFINFKWANNFWLKKVGELLFHCWSGWSGNLPQRLRHTSVHFLNPSRGTRNATPKFIKQFRQLSFQPSDKRLKSIHTHTHPYMHFRCT